MVESRPPPHVLMIYAADGLERAVMLRPDLIVLDFGFDGELVARLRGDDATSAIPIIALTDVCRLGKTQS